MALIFGVLDLIPSLRCSNCGREFRTLDGTDWSLEKDGWFHVHCACGIKSAGRIELQAVSVAVEGEIQ